MKKKLSRNRCTDGSRYLPIKCKKKGLLDAFREPKEISFGPDLQLTGGHTLDISGCTSILAYDSDLVRLKVRGAILTILGIGLKASDFSSFTLTVKGEIRSISLEPASPNRKKELR